MPLVNRDKDQSEQRETYNVVVNGTPSGISAGVMNPGVATAQTFPLVNIAFPCTLVTAAEAAYGLSGSPQHSLWIYRFAGGFTSIAVSTTLVITAFGTSGVLAAGGLGFSLIAANAATFPLQAGDQLVLYTQAANTAVANATITLVVKALQDIKSHFGQ